MDLHQFCELLREQIMANIQSIGHTGCIRWCDTVRDEKHTAYMRIRAKSPGEVSTECKSVLQLILQMDMGLLTLPRDVHVSHLCHISSCNVSHMLLEAHSVKNERRLAVCFGHLWNDKRQPDCILWYLFLYISSPSLCMCIYVCTYVSTEWYLKRNIYILQHDGA